MREVNSMSATAQQPDLASLRLELEVLWAYVSEYEQISRRQLKKRLEKIFLALCLAEGCNASK